MLNIIDYAASELALHYCIIKNTNDFNEIAITSDLIHESIIKNKKIKRFIDYNYSEMNILNKKRMFYSKEGVITEKFILLAVGFTKMQIYDNNIELSQYIKKFTDTIGLAKANPNYVDLNDN